jgi:phosphoesterase RecJ-like protein
MVSPDFIQSLKNILDSNHKFVIISHKNPDGDALGSSLAWLAYLKSKRKSAYFISPTYYTESLSWMPQTEDIVVYEDYKTKKHATNILNSADVIFCLDFNAVSRLDELGELVKASPAKKIMIDHHQMPEDFADLTFSDTSYGATAEMIFTVLDELGEIDKISPAVATNLYTGIATDTGFFQFSNTTPRIHSYVGRLLALGVDPAFVSDQINSTFRDERLHYFGYLLHQKLKVVNNGTVAYIFITEKEAKDFHILLGENESLVNYPFKIKGIKVSVLFSEEKGMIKISFRSKEKYDVNDFARKYFNGGGHINAAGGKSLDSIEETEKKFISLMPEIFN